MAVAGLRLVVLAIVTNALSAARGGRHSLDALGDVAFALGSGHRPASVWCSRDGTTAPRRSAGAPGGDGLRAAFRGAQPDRLDLELR